jgi:peptide chain release factor 2
MTWPRWARAMSSCGGTFDLPARRARLEELQVVSSDPALWQDAERAEAVLREKRGLERLVAFHDETDKLISDVRVLLDLADEEADADAVEEAAAGAQALGRRFDEAELRRMLSGEHDRMDAIVTLTAGAGGTDASDWCEMLMRMYLRWCETHGFQVEVLDIQPADEAGLRSVTLAVRGEYAYGHLRSEIGVHRLVRISPFDAQKRRQTSFASLSMIPDIGDTVEVDIKDEDLRIDTYRAGGAGGQHVNRTDSAVRITHLPTGIVVQCQNERSQHKNRASAMKVLKARLYQRAREEHDAEVERLAGEKKKIDFASQIRSYTIHPQQRVKDHRTDVEAGNATAVLDGDLDRFMRAFLLQQAGAA